MTVVALRLTGPLQSWGSGSRFVRRATEAAPTKSGVIGLVAAALGLQRTDPLDQLVELRFGVRVDQPGRLLQDFQTAQKPQRARDGSVTWKSSLPVSHRYYRTDAAYLAVLEADRELLEAIDTALRRPAFPLYLGRRSCPPAGPVALGIHDLDLESALASLPWLAREHHRRTLREREVRLETLRDVRPGETATGTARDLPISFDPHHRRYAWRSLVHGVVVVHNDHGTETAASEHDPMTLLGD
ncbi:type I-E CRISPR-associated protein Cas5/CasD [Kribbella sp. NPDC059898]|uniref:type I-E CRISPR-associated protein Cas5/CasD n=1 Tax=Kribbella sp. NPDC059898 TaxID=3346995 RepID=UPI003647898F